MHTWPKRTNLIDFLLISSITTGAYRVELHANALLSFSLRQQTLRHLHDMK